MTGKKGSNQYAKARQLGLPVPESACKGRPGTFLGKKHTAESKECISEKLSANNKGGRCLWYEVAGQRVQGTWEKRLAEKMEELQLSWRKLRLNVDTIAYAQNGKQRHYTPDFEVEGLLVEVKGFWREVDREKMQYVFRSHPDLILKIVERKEFEQLLQSVDKQNFLAILGK